MPRNEDMIRGKEYSASVSVPYASAWGEGKGSGQWQLSTPAGELVRGIVSLISFCQPHALQDEPLFQNSIGSSCQTLRNTACLPGKILS